MAKESAIGEALTIPEEVFDRLGKAEEQILELEQVTNQAAASIVSAFRRMSDGLSPFISSLSDAAGGVQMFDKAAKGLTEIGKSSESMEKMSRNMVKMAETSNRLGDSGKYSAAAWQGLQYNIEQLEVRQKSLLSITERYENTLSKMQSGAGGSLSHADREGYQAAKLEYEQNEKTIASYREKQEAIIATQTALTEELRLVQSLRQQEQQRGSLPEQRSREELAKMNEYYRELEKTSAQAAKAQEHAAAQAAKAQERAATQAAKAQERAAAQAAKAAEREAKARDMAAKAAEREAKRKLDAQAKLDSRLRKLNYQSYVTSPEGALRTADRANTYNQRAQAMKNLEQAIKNLNKNDKDYQNTLDRLIRTYKKLKAQQDEVSRSMGTMQTTQGGMMNITDQLTRRLALVFSLSQIQQYVTSLARVRGEFELQNAALTAILQNKDEADKLFGQITALAVQSPFTLSELTRYTKELAAYRIENEKLYDTTKMLADVSAGLGVDMSRLILAYGQVKAANYLRGTELRQFSEAGINILGELATYFSEIENRAISVGEVFEMVSNRMVSFSDVQEIFRRLTSDGGIFANMQEVQSRTLAGMISNMKDAFDVMRNEIGIDYEDQLKGAVSAVRDLAANWRELAFVAKLAGQSLLPFITYIGLARVAYSNFSTRVYKSLPILNRMDDLFVRLGKTVSTWPGVFRKAGAAVNVLATGLRGLATIAAPVAIMALIGGIIELVRRMTAASREAKRLNEELSKLVSQDVNNVRNSVGAFVDLVDQLKEVNSGSEEHREIIEKINSQYGEYLGYIVSETTAYEQLKKSINDVSRSMMRKAQIATQEKALQEIYEKQNDSIQKAQKNLRQYLQSANFTTLLGRMPSEQEISSIFNIVEQKTKELGRDLNSNDFAEILQEFFAKPLLYVYDEYVYLVSGALKDYSGAIITAEKNIEQYTARINAMYGERYTTAAAIAAIEENNARRQMELEEIRGRSGTTKEEVARLTKALNQLYDINEVGIKVQFGILTPEEGVREKERIMKWVSETAEDVNRKVKEILSKQGFTEDMISPYLITADMETQGYPEIEKTVLANYKQATESIERLNRLREAGNRINENQLAQLKLVQQGWKAVADAMGLSLEKESTVNKRESEALQRLKAQIDAIRQAGKAYREARENYSEEDATEKVRKDYEALFDETGIGDMITDMTFDASGLLKAYNELLEKASQSAGEKGRIALEKEMADVKGDIDVNIRIANREAVQSEFSKMLSDYELTNNFRDLGLDEDMASLLGFKFTTIDDIKANLAEYESRLAELGIKDEELFKKLQKDLSDIEKKEMEDRTNKYLDYLKKSMDERLQIEAEYQRKLTELDQTALNKRQKAQARTNLTRERDQSLAEYDWSQFKGTDLYRAAFEDLDRVGTATLNRLIEKLDEFSKRVGKSLPTEAFRELMNSLKNVRNELESRNPFKMLANGIAAYENAMNRYNAEVAVNASIRADTRYWTREQSAAKQDVAAAREEFDSSSIDARTAALARLEQAEARLARANASLALSNLKLKESDDRLVATETEIQSSRDKVEESAKAIQSEYSQMTSSINGLIDSFVQLAEGMGLAFTDEEKAAIEGFQKGFQVLGTIMSAVLAIVIAITIAGYEMQAALWPLLIIGAALGAVFAIVNANKAAREAYIENEQNKVDDLANSYDDLKDSIDDAISSADLKRLEKGMTSNIDQQIEAYKNMIAAEESAKNPDYDAINDYYDKIEELEKQRQEDLQSLLKEAGGIGKEEYLSTAEDFVRAWLDAFKETGNGLSGLEDNFKDFFEDILVRQAALAITDKFMEPWLDDLNSKLNDYKLDQSEAESLIASWEAMLPGMNDALTAIFERFRNYLSSSAEDSLSGLQKGIQGITEETAQALEALLNSVRYYTADSNTQLHAIFSVLAGTNGDYPNPMLVELRSQTRLQTSINRLLGSVVKSGHPDGGEGIKIFMN